MFGEGGWLVSEEEGGKGYGKWVKELELNRSKTIKFGELDVSRPRTRPSLFL